jgi:hypothetical protein
MPARVQCSNRRRGPFVTYQYIALVHTILLLSATATAANCGSSSVSQGAIPAAHHGASSTAARASTSTSTAFFRVTASVLHVSTTKQDHAGHAGGGNAEKAAAPPAGTQSAVQAKGHIAGEHAAMYHMTALHGSYCLGFADIAGRPMSGAALLRNGEP